MIKSLSHSESPSRLKRLLVPCWNAAHQYGWIAHDYLDAAVHRRFEHCPVCGRFRPMLYRRRVIPRRLEELWGLSPRLAESLARKESCDCASCGAKLRCRRIAEAVLALYPVGNPPVPAPSLARWVEYLEIQSLRIAEINRIDGLHDVLLRLPQFASSDYRPGSAPGAVVDGVRSEDLTRLTYPDDAFDLVLTSESLEHVPDLDAALSEIRRVLVPGGRHIFTVPVLPETPRTFPAPSSGPMGASRTAPRGSPTRAGIGAIRSSPSSGPICPICCVGRGSRSNVLFGPTRDDDLAQVYVCRKPV